jgi:cell wall assembly regulator SMI1
LISAFGQVQTFETSGEMEMNLPPSKTWFRNEGASVAALQALADAVEVALPMEYLELLAFSNGGEGPLAAPFHNLCLDDAESAAEPGRVELFKNLYPGWFVFGGDGGGELYAFDLTGEQPWPVIRFDGIDPEGSVEDVAESFVSFMQLQANAEADADGQDRT